MLHKELKALIQSCNEELRADILSPYTITLGDEFQGLATSLEASIKTLFFIEECLKQKLGFKLHYALHLGEIETEINPNIAYEMMGPGFTKTREMLTSKKRSRKRFEFDLNNESKSVQFSRLFEILDTIILSWKKKITCLSST